MQECGQNHQHLICAAQIIYPNILQILLTHENKTAKTSLTFRQAQESWSPCSQITECEINLQSPSSQCYLSLHAPAETLLFWNFIVIEANWKKWDYKLKEMRLQKPDLLPIHVQVTWSTRMLWSLKRIFAAVFISSSVESPYCLQSFIINFIIWSCK